ncbi:hypothetical protein MLD38_002461 [Melastoma candidum]|uniref:Uncharacterized protein n=1 Tax=Melastoma candidum TaxID=119954 RepID=A0ACB9RYN5_9MYRT|nr:hypothetical protein MLD38_002461 [Melastoma candidum]
MHCCRYSEFIYLKIDNSQLFSDGSSSLVVVVETDDEDVEGVPRIINYSRDRYGLKISHDQCRYKGERAGA